MIYNRIIYLIITLLMGLELSAQVTIGSGDSPHEAAVLELKSNDRGFLGPRVQLIDYSNPYPIQNPAVGLLVFNIADHITEDESILGQRFYYWTGDKWNEFIYEEMLEDEINDILKELGIPRSAVFHLNGADKIDNRNPSKPVLGMFDVMKGADLGEGRELILKETVNETNGDVRLQTYRLPNDTRDYAQLVFKPGTYSITFAYQFIPSVNASPRSTIPQQKCTASSYFMDFPLESTTIKNDRARIHNVAYHDRQRNGHHGGSISYVVRIQDAQRIWWIKLGAGQSGINCNDDNDLAIEGFSLMNENTFFLISRIGD